MRYLVTGGAGFIGSHLVELLSELDHDIVVIDNFSSGRTRVNGVQYIKADLAQEAHMRSLRMTAFLEKVDFVFHLAGHIGVKRCYDEPEQSFRNNVIASHNVVLACKHLEIPVLETSSSSVYGRVISGAVDERGDITFGDPGNRSWQYGLHKAVAEADARNAGAMVVRLFNVIGPRQREDYGFVAPRFIKQIMEGRPVTIYGSGSQTRSFCDVRDIVRGLLTISQRGQPGNAYNLGSEQEIRILALANLIGLTLGVPIKYEFVAAGKELPLDYEETPQRLPNLTKVRALGYRPEFDIVDTIKWIAREEYGYEGS